MINIFAQLQQLLSTADKEYETFLDDLEPSIRDGHADDVLTTDSDRIKKQFEDISAAFDALTRTNEKHLKLVKALAKAKQK